MAVACGRYAPFGHCHPEEENCFYGNSWIYLNQKGVKIGLSQGVNFQLTFRISLYFLFYTQKLFFC